MMAKALSSNGAAKVYILGRRLEKLQETAKVCFWF
jgi:NADP-dependent 3-hydroxy acid dehydrogenase YdfG